MYASIIPIRRLPAKIKMFDYAVPKGLCNIIQPGHLVSVPFRKSEIFGLVFNLSKNTNQKNRNLKEITSITNETPLIYQNGIDIILLVSKLYGVAPSSIAKMMLPPLQKRKIKMCKLVKHNKKKNKNEKKQIYHTYSNKLEHEYLLNSLITGVTLILVPEIQLIEEVVNILKKTHKDEIITWHSKLSVKKQFSNWVEIRNSEKTIIVGTRSSIFLPIPNLENIIIDYEHASGHKNWDTSPRFDVRDISEILSESSALEIHKLTYSPSLSGYYSVKKKIYDCGNEINMPQLNVEVVDMIAERHGQNFTPLCFSAQQILESAKENILIYLNRKGNATTVLCKECKHVESCNKCGLALTFYSDKKTLQCNFCKTKRIISLKCPVCGESVMTLKGHGIQGIADYVNNFLNGKKTHSIKCIDSDISEYNLNDKPNIIIGTDAAMPFVDWNKTEAIICINIDSQLFIPDYMATENIWHILRNINFYKNPSSRFLIQTYTPNHVIFRSFLEPERFYRTDLNLRRSLLYPPYSYLIRYFYGNSNKKIAELKAIEVSSKLSKELTENKIKAKILGPIEMFPQYYRNKFWFTIIIKSDKMSWKENLLFLNKYIPDEWKIDPNPLSALSP